MQEANEMARRANKLAEEGGRAEVDEAMELIRTRLTQISEIIQVISKSPADEPPGPERGHRSARAGEHEWIRRGRRGASWPNGRIRPPKRFRPDQGVHATGPEGPNSARTRADRSQIIEGVESTAAKIAEIAAATIEQAANADEVSKAIQGVAQVTEQTAAGSEEMAFDENQPRRRACNSWSPGSKPIDRILSERLFDECRPTNPRDPAVVRRGRRHAATGQPTGRRGIRHRDHQSPRTSWGDHPYAAAAEVSKA